MIEVLAALENDLAASVSAHRRQQTITALTEIIIPTLAQISEFSPNTARIVSAADKVRNVGRSYIGLWKSAGASKKYAKKHTVAAKNSPTKMAMAKKIGSKRVAVKKAAAKKATAKKSDPRGYSR